MKNARKKLTIQEKQDRQDQRMIVKISAMTKDAFEAMVKKANKARKRYLNRLAKGLTLAASTLAPTPPPPTPAIPEPPKKNHIAIVIDESGSMGYLLGQVIKAVNDQIDTIKAEAKKTGQETTATFVTFANRDIKERFFQRELDRLQPIDRSDYSPGGNTPLLDAVGKTIEHMLQQKDATDENVSFLIITVTDGEENSSHEYNSRSLAEKLKKCQATDRWSFAFLAPPGGKSTLMGLGVPEGNIMEWEATQAGLHRASVALNMSTQGFYATRASGQRSTKGYFVTDMSKVDPAEVRRNCANISSQVKFAATNGVRATIRDFCEQNFGGAYLKGAAFYELVKPETVQEYKKVIIVDKVTGDVYGGPDARRILGLPNYNVRVKPGDHGNWTIYVQSTSFNRMLPPKTKLAYWSAGA